MENRTPVVDNMIISACISLPFLAAAVIIKGIYVPLQIGSLEGILPAFLDFRMAIAVICLFAFGRKATLGVLCGYAISLLIHSNHFHHEAGKTEIIIPMLTALVLILSYWKFSCAGEYSPKKTTLIFMLGAVLTEAIMRLTLYGLSNDFITGVRIAFQVAIGQSSGFFLLIVFGVMILRVERSLGAKV